MVVDIRSPLMLAVGQPYALLEVSLQGASLCNVGGWPCIPQHQPRDSKSKSEGHSKSRSSYLMMLHIFVLRRWGQWTCLLFRRLVGSYCCCYYCCCCSCDAVWPHPAFRSMGKARPMKWKHESWQGHGSLEYWALHASRRPRNEASQLSETLGGQVTAGLQSRAADYGTSCAWLRNGFSRATVCSISATGRYYYRP